MKALISPNEKVYDYESNVGQRIAQVESDDKIFAVASPLHWVDCPDDCVADIWWYYQDVCQPIPQPPEPTPEP
jgi:hypothetical protein